MRSPSHLPAFSTSTATALASSHRHLPEFLTSEVLAKRSRNKNRTFAAPPVLLALIVFAGPAVVRVTAFAVQSTASGTRRETWSDSEPDWPRLVQNSETVLQVFRINGGERGIRTLDRVSPIHAFQACAFNHSAISPGRRGTVLRRQKRPRQFSLTRARPHTPTACYHGRTMLLDGLDRRDWMRLVAVLSAASAGEAQAPQGQTPAAPPARVTKEMLHGTLQLIGLDFTDAQE